MRCQKANVVTKWPRTHTTSVATSITTCRKRTKKIIMTTPKILEVFSWEKLRWLWYYFFYDILNRKLSALKILRTLEREIRGWWGGEGGRERGRETKTQPSRNIFIECKKKKILLFYYQSLWTSLNYNNISNNKKEIRKIIKTKNEI